MPAVEDAIAIARRRILGGEAVRMQEIAAELGVTRVTLHRWVGGREDLLGEALWSLAEANFRAAVRRTRTRGGRRVADVVARFVAGVRAEPGMRVFLEREPELALRVLTTKASPVQARSVQALERLLREEAGAGRLDPPLPFGDLAYVIVRITESFLYADLITGEPAADDAAHRAIAALLR